MAAGVSIVSGCIPPRSHSLFLVWLLLTLVTANVESFEYKSDVRRDLLATDPYINYPCPRDQCVCYKADQIGAGPAVSIKCMVERFEPSVSSRLIQDVSDPRTAFARFTCASEQYASWSQVPESTLWSSAFSGMGELRELAFSKCAFSTVTGSAFTGLDSLQKLSIHGATISVLDSDSLASIPNLASLQVTYSGVTLVAALCTTGTRLRELNLTGNTLASFDAAGVRCTGGSGRGPPLSSLENLDLRYNAITSWPPWLSSSLPGLYYLAVGHNRISISGGASLRGLRNLHVLDLSNNNITDFPDDFFRDASRSLSDLLLSHNPVGSLPPDLLSGLVGLSTLDLSAMDLSSQVWSELSQLGRLTHLNLSANRLQDIRPDVLARLTVLKSLDLGQNQITSLPDAVFASQQTLQTLELSHNSLQSVPASALSGAVLLNELSLDHNAISSLRHNCLSRNSELTAIYLSHNRLTSLPTGLLANQVKLATLDLSFNNLRWLDDGLFTNCQVLSSLNVSHNQMSGLPTGPLPRGMETLDFSHNQIKNPISETLLKGLVKVKVISFRDNKLSSLPLKFFDSCDRLVSLDLSQNMISRLDENLFDGTPMLEVVDLSNNELETVGSVFSGLERLRVLNLSRNKLLSVVKGQFPPRVEHLDLSNNKIESILSAAFKSLSSLKTVDLKANKLTTLSRMDVEIPYNSIYSPTFYLSFNKFVCDCELGWLKDWQLGTLEETSTLPNFDSISYISCSHPSSRYTTLAALDRSEFLCNYKEHCEPDCVCCKYGTCFCKYRCPDKCSCYRGDEYLSVHRVTCSAGGLTEIPPDVPEGATELRLDGNDFQDLPRHAFLALIHVQSLYLNNSNVRSVQNHTFKGLKSLRQLFLNNNGLTEIFDAAFDGLDSLEELFLHNNNIFVIESPALLVPTLLKTITLHENSLVTLSLNDMWSLFNRSKAETAEPSAGQLVKRSSPDVTISLSGNPWTCEKSFACSFLSFLQAFAGNIRDLKHITCQPEPDLVTTSPGSVDQQDGEQKASGVMANDHQFIAHGDQAQKEIKILDLEIDVCDGEKPSGKGTADNTTIFNGTAGPTETNADRIDPKSSDKRMYTVLAICVVIAFTLILLVAVVVNRHVLQVLCYTWFGCRVTKPMRAADEVNGAGYEKYDAFICHSKKDEDFVLHQLVPRLEGDNNFRLCFPNRDFPCAECLAETIVRGVNASKRTVCLLSRNFLESAWCTLGFQAAHEQLLKEKRSRIIIVILDDLDLSKIEDRELKNHLRTRTYLRVGEPLFWEKLAFALPDVGRRNRRSKNGSQRRRQLEAGDINGGKADTADLVATRLPSLRDLDYMDRDRRLAEQQQPLDQEHHQHHSLDIQLQQQENQSHPIDAQVRPQEEELLSRVSSQHDQAHVQHQPPSYTPQQYPTAPLPTSLRYHYQPEDFQSHHQIPQRQFSYPHYYPPHHQPAPQSIQRATSVGNHHHHPHHYAGGGGSLGGGGFYRPPHHHHPDMYENPSPSISPMPSEQHYHVARTLISPPNGHAGCNSAPSVVSSGGGAAAGVAGDGRWHGVMATPSQQKLGSSQGSFRNTAFYNSDDSCSTSGYHKGSGDSSNYNNSCGGGHYEEVGGGNLSGVCSVGSTPIKIVDGRGSEPTPPPVPLIPKEGFAPVERLVSLNT